MCTNLKCSLGSLVAAGDWDYVTQYGADVVNQLLDHRTSTDCGCELQLCSVIIPESQKQAAQHFLLLVLVF